MADEVETSIQTRLAYDGLGLRDGTMDVRDLGPALVCLGELLQDANEVLNGNRAVLTLRVQSDFREGSFDYGVVVNLAWVGHAMSPLLGHEGLKTAKEIAEYIGLITGVQVSLFGFIRWLNGRKPDSATKLEDGSVQVVVNGNNNTVLVVPREVYELAETPKVRSAAAGVVKPLQKPGITSLEVRDKGVKHQLASDADVESFAAVVDPLGDPACLPREAFLEVIKPSFDKSLKWMFSDGSHRFSAEMKDETYLAGVSEKRRAFVKGTFMRVRMRSVPKIVDGKLKTFHEILEVLDDEPQPRLLPEPS